MLRVVKVNFKGWLVAIAHAVLACYLVHAGDPSVSQFRLSEPIALLIFFFTSLSPISGPVYCAGAVFLLIVYYAIRCENLEGLLAINLVVLTLSVVLTASDFLEFPKSAIGLAVINVVVVSFLKLRGGTRLTIAEKG